MKKQTQQDQIKQLANEYLTKAINLGFSIYKQLFRKEYYNVRHLSVSFTNGSMSVDWIHHCDYVLEKEAELTEIREKLKVEDFIFQALESCNKCNFILFDCGDDGRFVQFWMGDGKYICNWPMAKGNKLKKYKLAMLGVLNEMGIIRDFMHKNGWPNKTSNQYALISYSDCDEYVINFGKDTKQAAQFTQQVITEVFKQKLDHLNFKIG